MSWDIEGTDEFASWYFALGEQEKLAVERAVGLLAGPWTWAWSPDGRYGTWLALHQPERAAASRWDLRVLFAFDPRRSAVLLLGGDKTNRWNQWYQEMIPVAEALYEWYLEELRKEGLIK